jgi:ribonuclease R
VDGLVHITALDNDYYHFDPVGHRLTGERSGQVYRLGDQVEIKVAAVNLDDRKIDFVLSDSGKTTEGARRPKAKRKPARKRALSKAIDEIMDAPEETKKSKNDNKKRKGKKRTEKVAKSPKRITKRKKQKTKK